METILFLDVDGVFSIPNPDNTDERKEHMTIRRGQHTIVCWPIPLCREILSALNKEQELHPVWLSAWGSAANAFNRRALVDAFPVAYTLTEQHARYAADFAARIFHGKKIERKLVAVLYYLRNKPHERILWLEDGFTHETRKWADRRPNVHLIDTTEEPIKRLLLSSEERAVDELIKLL